MWSRSTGTSTASSGGKTRSGTSIRSSGLTSTRLIGLVHDGAIALRRGTVPFRPVDVETPLSPASGRAFRGSLGVVHPGASGCGFPAPAAVATVDHRRHGRGDRAAADRPRGGAGVRSGVHPDQRGHPGLHPHLPRGDSVLLVRGARGHLHGPERRVSPRRRPPLAPPSAGSGRAWSSFTRSTRLFFAISRITLEPTIGAYGPATSGDRHIEAARSAAGAGAEPRRRRHRGHGSLHARSSPGEPSRKSGSRPGGNAAAPGEANGGSLLNGIGGVSGVLVASVLLVEPACPRSWSRLTARLHRRQAEFANFVSVVWGVGLQHRRALIYLPHLVLLGYAARSARAGAAADRADGRRGAVLLLQKVEMALAICGPVIVAVVARFWTACSRPAAPEPGPEAQPHPHRWAHLFSQLVHRGAACGGLGAQRLRSTSRSLRKTRPRGTPPHG